MYLFVEVPAWERVAGLCALPSVVADKRMAKATMSNALRIVQ
jgi:hypothetical protein